jgi:hypothetical protein
MQAEVVLDRTQPAVSPTGNNTHTLASPSSQVEPVPVPIARSTGRKKDMGSARHRPSELNVSDVNTPSLMSPFLSEQYYGKVGGQFTLPSVLKMLRISCASLVFFFSCMMCMHPDAPLLVVCHAAGCDIRQQYEEHDFQQEPKDAQRVSKSKKNGVCESSKARIAKPC